MKYYLIIYANALCNLFYDYMAAESSELCIADFNNDNNKYGYFVIAIRELSLDEMANFNIKDLAL